jgi:hypothetical protein
MNRIMERGLGVDMDMQITGVMLFRFKETHSDRVLLA